MTDIERFGKFPWLRGDHFIPFMLVLIVGASTCDLRGQSLSAEELHKLMAARDRQVNNAKLVFVRTGVENITKPQIAGQYELRHVPYQVNERIVVRNGEVTFFGDTVDSYGNLPNNAPHLTPHTKWTNRDGYSKQLISSDTVKTAVATYMPDHLSGGEANTKLWKTALTLGFDFGRRMDTFNVVGREGDLTHVTGTIRLSDKDIAKCDIKVDHDWIVRSAFMRVGSEQSWFEYEISNKGIYKVGDFSCAKDGSFKSTFCVMNDKNKLERNPRQEFNIALQSISLNLSDADYESLTAFSIPEGVQVIDPHNLRPKPPKPLPWRAIAFSANAIIVVIVLLMLIYRHRSRSASLIKGNKS